MSQAVGFLSECGGLVDKEIGGDPFFQFSNIKKSYDGFDLAVKDFNLDVSRGEFVALLSPSGSGKMILPSSSGHLVKAVH